MNHVILVGRLATEPEIGTAADGCACRYRLAVDRPRAGGPVEADIVEVVVPAPHGELEARVLEVGDLVAVMGRLHHDTWIDDDGQVRERHEVVADKTVQLHPGHDAPAIPRRHSHPAAIA
jgi:single-stranded DNA-binding protein